MDVPARTPEDRRPSALRYVLIPAVAAVTLVGIWVFGGLLSNSFRASMGLVALWLAIAFVVSVVVLRRAPSIGRVVMPTFLVTAVLVGGYLAIKTFGNKTVNEVVVVAGRGGNVGLGRAEFVSGEHSTSGTAAIVRTPAGKHFVTITDLDTSSGPDLRVYLTENAVGSSGSSGDHVDLGGLKGNRGTQQYEIPADVQLDRFRNVLIWCRAFSVAFGEATLEG